MHTVNSARIAFFLASINLTDKLKIANDLRESLSILDGDPLIMPIPNDAPSEIPRIILRSKNEVYSLVIAPQRIDFFHNNKENDVKSYDEYIKGLLKNIDSIVNIVVKNFAGNIQRLGLIIDFSLEKEDAIDYILKNFNKSFVHKENLLEAQIHLFNKEVAYEFNINNWVRIIGQKHNTSKPKIRVSNDINTILGKDRSFTFTIDKVMKFYNSMFKYVMNNIKHYV